ncbi:high mobility group protein 20A [Scaptodrosophila lebanonensis]|uniref:High mobility group protein 20A n=1 Tax=Drosophila lebanonensis TaxID=7225 RepID=A0A6J2TF85_DROLE|nr:high mobility group protein 20A [Scaptodrosophila lebanonensis]
MEKEQTNTAEEPTGVSEDSTVEAMQEQLSKSINLGEVGHGENNISMTDEKPAGKAGKNKCSPKARRTVAGTDTSIEPDIRKLKQRRINVAGAPKMPLNGYVRFMNDRREMLRRDYPNRTALEHTKMIGEEWQALPDERKAPYLDAAAKDRAKYHEELNKFLKEHPDIWNSELAKINKSNNSATVDQKIGGNKEKSNNNISTNNSGAGTSKKQGPKCAEVKRQSGTNSNPDDLSVLQTLPPSAAHTPAVTRPYTATEIPIFTNEFLDHNRNVEIELRTLRKTKTDLEQQNDVLGQHVENTKAGSAKITGEVAELQEETKILKAYNKALRQKLILALRGVGLPALSINGPTEDNLDRYMQHLADLTTTATGQNDPTFQLARDLLLNVDFTDLQKS